MVLNFTKIPRQREEKDSKKATEKRETPGKKERKKSRQKQRKIWGDAMK